MKDSIEPSQYPDRVCLSMVTDSSFFVTSTGTDIGKTVATRAMAEVFTAEEESVGYFKSVASGCEPSEWGYRSPDEVEMISAGGLDPDDVTASFRFNAPLSPDRAASRENKQFTVEDIMDKWKPFRESYDRVLVEGIGGVAVPFNESEDVVDLIEAMDIPAVIVVQSTLGTISYTRTAMHYLRDRQCDVRGILLTPEEGRDIEQINREHLQSIYPDAGVQLLPDVGTVENNVEDRVRTFLKGCQLL